MYDINILYDNVMDFIYKRNLKQSQVCKACKISNMTMSRWKKNQYYPSLETIIKLANFFGVTIDELFGVEMIEFTALDERETFRKFQKLSKENKELVVMLINSYYRLEGLDKKEKAVQEVYE